MANVDANYEYVAKAYNGTDVVPLKVDPATGRLLIDVVASPSGSATPSQKVDNNRTWAATAYDGTNIKPLLCDGSGYLVVDLTT